MAMATAIATATATKHKISAQLSCRLLVLGSSVSVPPICYQKLYRMEGIRQQFAGQQLQRQVFCSMPNRIIVNEEYKATATATATDISELFENWCKKHGKTYSSEEEKRYRFNIFQKTYEKITRHNQMGKSWTAGLNQFSDRTFDEMRDHSVGSFPSPPPSFWNTYSNRLCEGLISREQYFQVLKDYVRADAERRGEGLISRKQYLQMLEDYVPADTERRGTK